MHLQPVKPAMKSSHMWSVEPAMPQYSYKKKDQVKQVSLCNDKNCQSIKCIYMWPVKSAMKSSHMQSVETAMLQSSYKNHGYKECQVRPVSLCDDKNCQSTRNCQFSRCVHVQPKNAQ